MDLNSLSRDTIITLTERVRGTPALPVSSPLLPLLRQELRLSGMAVFAPLVGSLLARYCSLSRLERRIITQAILSGASALGMDYKTLENRADIGRGLPPELWPLAEKLAHQIGHYVAREDCPTHALFPQELDDVLRALTARGGAYRHESISLLYWLHWEAGLIGFCPILSPGMLAGDKVAPAGSDLYQRYSQKLRACFGSPLAPTLLCTRERLVTFGVWLIGAGLATRHTGPERHTPGKWPGRW